MSIFEALTTGLDDTDRNQTLDLIATRFADDQAAAREGRPHRDVDERVRGRRRQVTTEASPAQVLEFPA